MIASGCQRNAKSMKSTRRGILLMLSCLILITQVRALDDWQVVASNVVSGTAFPSTNLVVRKMTASALREDISSAVSMLFFVPKQEQVVLNHLEKTYVRQNSHGTDDSPAGTLS